MEKNDIKVISGLGLIALMIFGTNSAKAEEVEKNPEDPTKIVTKAGVAYVDESFGLSGSIGLDETRISYTYEFD